MKNVDLHDEILLQECYTEIMNILALENKYQIKAQQFYTDLSLHQLFCFHHPLNLSVNRKIQGLFKAFE